MKLLVIASILICFVTFCKAQNSTNSTIANPTITTTTAATNNTVTNATTTTKPSSANTLFNNFALVTILLGISINFFTQKLLK